MAKDRRSDRVTTSVELGPRSLALLRRIVAGLEQLNGGTIPDPGKGTEDETIDWPEDE